MEVLHNIAGTTKPTNLKLGSAPWYGRDNETNEFELFRSFLTWQGQRNQRIRSVQVLHNVAGTTKPTNLSCAEDVWCGMDNKTNEFTMFGSCMIGGANETNGYELLISCMIWQRQLRQRIRCVQVLHDVVLFDDILCSPNTPWVFYTNKTIYWKCRKHDRFMFLDMPYT